MKAWINRAPSILFADDKLSHSYRLGEKQLARWHRECKMKRLKDKRERRLAKASEGGASW